MLRSVLHGLAVAPLLVGCAPRTPLHDPGKYGWTATVVDLHPDGSAHVDGAPMPSDASIRGAVAAARDRRRDLRGLVIAHPSVPVERRTAVAALVWQGGISEIDVIEVPFVDLPAAPTLSRSSPVAGVRRPNLWRCPLPFEAYDAGIDRGMAEIRVVVGTDATPKAVALLHDSGHGHGRAAAACAMRQRYLAATDASGRPVEAVTPPIRVRFVR